MESPVGEYIHSGDEDLSKNIHARIPVVVGVRLIIDGGVKHAMVVPLGAEYPHRGPVEGQRSGGPERCRQSERAVMIIPVRTKKTQVAIIGNCSRKGKSPTRKVGCTYDCQRLSAELPSLQVPGGE